MTYPHCKKGCVIGTGFEPSVHPGPCETDRFACCVRCGVSRSAHGERGSCAPWREDRKTWEEYHANREKVARMMENVETVTFRSPVSVDQTDEHEPDPHARCGCGCHDGGGIMHMMSCCATCGACGADRLLYVAAHREACTQFLFHGDQGG